MNKLSKLKWFDWLFVLITVMMLLPIVIYAYTVLIFGGIGWNAEQIHIAIAMAILWLFVSAFYIPHRLV